MWAGKLIMRGMIEWLFNMAMRTYNYGDGCIFDHAHNENEP